MGTDRSDLGRWLHSSIIAVDGRALGRISARGLADGRTEFNFLRADSGNRILPSRRYIPAGDATNWLHSTRLRSARPAADAIVSAKRSSGRGRTSYALNWGIT